jgi:phosphate transport system protein
MKSLADVGRMGARRWMLPRSPLADTAPHALPEGVNGYFAEMGCIAVSIGHSAKDVVLSRDSDNAAELARHDDAMEALRRHLSTILMDHHMVPPRRHRRGHHTAEPLPRISRYYWYYERFADRTVEIARQVILHAGTTTA